MQKFVTGEENPPPRTQLRSKFGGLVIHHPIPMSKTKHISNLVNTTHVAQSRCHLSPSLCVKLASTNGLTSSESSHAHLPHRPFLCESPLVFLISTASSCNTPSSGSVVIPHRRRSPRRSTSAVSPLVPKSPLSLPKAHVCVCGRE